MIAKSAIARFIFTQYTSHFQLKSELVMALLKDLALRFSPRPGITKKHLWFQANITIAKVHKKQLFPQLPVKSCGCIQKFDISFEQLCVERFSINDCAGTVVASRPFRKL